MKWFNNPQTLEELKKQYKKLAFRHHPDVGGNNQDMQEINNEYDLLFARLKNTHRNASGEVYTSNQETTEAPQEYRDIISKLINIEGITIEICGTWLWVTGNTKPHKELFKELKFRWSNKKSAWYYHKDGYRKKSRRSLTLEEIRNLYGSARVEAERENQLATA
jgi:curved DNA-binding protein CbpA